MAVRYKGQFKKKKKQRKPKHRKATRWYPDTIMLLHMCKG